MGKKQAIFWLLLKFTANLHNQQIMNKHQYLHHLLVICLISSTSLCGISQSYFPIKINKKWGLIDGKGNMYLSPQYDAIGEFDPFGYALIQDQGKVGLINRRAKVTLQPIYKAIKVIDSTLFAVQKKDNWHIVNLHQQVILTEQFDKIELLRQGQFLAYRQKGKWGIVSTSGRQLTKAIYDEVTTTNFAYFLVKQVNKLGLINEQGSILLKPNYFNIAIQNSNLIFYKKNKHWGAIDSKGQTLIKPQWDNYAVLNQNFVKLRRAAKAGLYAFPQRKLISKDIYDDFVKYSDNMVLCRKNRRAGLMDISGNLIVKCKYNEIQNFSPQQFRVRRQNRWGVVNQLDSTIIDFDFDYIAPLNTHVCVVKKNGQYGLANYKGDIVVAPKYSRIDLEGNKAKSYNGKKLDVLLFDRRGQLKDKIPYNRVGRIKVGRGRRQLSNGVSRSDYVLRYFEWFYSPGQDKWGLRNIKTGNIQIQPTYDRIRIERDLGFTVVGLEKRSQLDFNRTGFRFEYLYGLVNNEKGVLVREVNLLDIRMDDFKRKNLPTARVVFQNGGHGLMARSGKILHKDYAFIGEFHHGLARMSPRGLLTASVTKRKNSLGLLNAYLTRIDSPNDMLDFTRYDQVFFNKAVLRCDKCTWGYMDTMGRIKIQPQYAFSRDYKSRVAIVQRSAKWGVIDLAGQQVLDFLYDDIQYLENSGDKMLQVQVHHKQYGLIDTMGQSIVEVAYDNIGAVEEGRVAVMKNRKWGFCDLSGRLVVACEYDEVQSFSEGLAAVKKNRRWGFINKNGEVVIPIRHKRVGNFNNQLAWVKTKGHYQYLTTDGTIAFSQRFFKAYDFNAGIARVQKNGYWGLIDTQGNFILVPKKYREIGRFNEYGLAIAQLGKNRRYLVVINRKGEKLTSHRFKKIVPFQDGFAAVRLRNSYGFINRQGELIIENQYPSVASFSEGRACVLENGKWGYIDTTGKYIIQPQFSKCLPFNDGRAVVYKGYKKSGLINAEGQYIIPPSISRLLAFSEQLGLVRNEEYNYYFINEQQQLQAGHFQHATAFKNGVATIQQRGKWGLISRKGLEIIPPKYDAIQTFHKGYAKVQMKRFNGVTNLKGTIIVEPNFEYISYSGDGIFRVERGDKMGYFNVLGDWVWRLSD